MGRQDVADFGLKVFEELLQGSMGLYLVYDAFAGVVRWQFVYLDRVMFTRNGEGIDSKELGYGVRVRYTESGEIFRSLNGNNKGTGLTIREASHAAQSRMKDVGP